MMGSGVYEMGLNLKGLIKVVSWSKIREMCSPLQSGIQLDTKLEDVTRICHSGLVGNTLTKEHRGRGFNPRYRHIHSGLDDHLKWRSSVIGSYSHWQFKVQLSLGDTVSLRSFINKFK